MSYSSVTLARRITIIGCCVVWVTLAAIGWQRTFQSTTLEASLTQTPEKAERALYVPSPLEVKLLSVEGGPWPRRFNSAHPPTPERLPELYSEAEASGLAAALASPS